MGLPSDVCTLIESFKMISHPTASMIKSLTFERVSRGETLDGRWQDEHLAVYGDGHKMCFRTADFSTSSFEDRLCWGDARAGVDLHRMQSSYSENQTGWGV